MSAAAPASLIVHGHFYQPPRENPWTDEIERQASAAPFHDWNERIAAECYTPNGWARLLDAEGRITGLVNNYASISFDVGPTLLRWLERHRPKTHLRIIEGERDSRNRYGGHGSAVAHPYVHAILPLADPRDRSALVRWGIADFQRRFGRAPEGMWLPETAVDLATLRLLVDHGIRFTVLAPFQAARFRQCDGGGWIDVGPEGIDPGRPYRCVTPGGGSIALFFYDASLSRAVAFEGLLQGPDHLAGRVAEGFRRSHPRLQILCTDGESYGHHTRFGERALAALDARQAASNDLTITNFGAYLESHPPDHEVVIREGSAWSCAHGLGRWKEDCGCSTGGQPGWRQGWRAPLRAALDGLRDELHGAFEEHGAKYLSDVWGARDAYIDLILDRSSHTVEAFVAQHARRALSAEERSAMLQLLEMQRHALLMQTSCGWFFDDISGIEPVQNLRHAARAIELASPFAMETIEARFLAKLQAARSNLPVERDGRRIWEVHVRTARVPLARLAIVYAARSLVDGLPDPYQLYGFMMHRLGLERRPTTGGTVVAGGVEIRSTFTLEREEFGFVLRWSDADGMAGYLFPWKGDGEFQRWREVIETEADAAVPQGHPQAVPVSLKMLSPEEREQVLMALYEGRVEAIHKVYDDLAARNRALLSAFVNEGFSPPEPLRTPSDYVLVRDLEARLREWLSEGGADAHRALLALADEARRLGLPRRDRIQDMLTASCVARLERLRDHPDLERFRSLQEILDIAERLDCRPEAEEIIVLVEDILAHRVPSLIEQLLHTGLREQYDLVSALLGLAERFGFATGAPRSCLRPFEERLAADPRLWP
jgi:hypothetical protein